MEGTGLQVYRNLVASLIARMKGDAGIRVGINSKRSQATTKETWILTDPDQ